MKAAAVSVTGGHFRFGGTYGGVGYYTANVGGLWDALLGEGRRWFNYASSDYHKHWTNCTNPADITTCGDDFYPGEYQKTYVYSQDKDRDGNTRSMKSPTDSAPEIPISFTAI